MHLTSSNNQLVRHVAFIGLRQAASNGANAKVLLQIGIVPQLLTLLQDKIEAPSHAIAAAVLEKVWTVSFPQIGVVYHGKPEVMYFKCRIYTDNNF